MRKTKRVQITGGLGLAVLGVLLLPLAISRTPTPAVTRAAARPPAPSPSHSPSAAALREARWYWGEAIHIVKPELEAWEEHPEVIETGTSESRRKQLMARDSGGQLLKARMAARRAAAAARTPAEAYQACYWQALFECEAGRHETELRAVQRLMAREPWNALSALSLRRAARCTGRAALGRQAEAVLEQLAPTASGASRVQELP